MNWYKNSQDNTQIISTENGYIKILENSPWSPDNRHSITDFVVEEDQRGQGVRTKLVSKLLEKYQGQPIAAQVSSIPSLKIFYNFGFRNPEINNKSLEEHIKMFNENIGSLMLIKN